MLGMPVVVARAKGIEANVVVAIVTAMGGFGGVRRGESVVWENPLSTLLQMLSRKTAGNYHRQALRLLQRPR